MTKTVYATVLAVLVGFGGVVFPLLPRHLTLIGAITIGIPAFLLSFEPSFEPARPGFIRRVMRFALPSGVVAAVGTFTVYGVTRTGPIDATLAESRTATTITLTLIGLYVLVALIRPLRGRHVVLVIGLFGLAAAAYAILSVRDALDLVAVGADVWATIGITLVVMAALVEVGLWVCARIGGHDGAESATTSGRGGG